MPRAANPDRKRAWVSLRVSDDEQYRMERRARAAGHANVSAYVRARCLTDPPERRALAAAAPDTDKPAPLPNPSPSDHLAAELAEQVRRAGVTVNQCARHLNEGRLLHPGMERELMETLAELRAYVRRARAL